MKLEDQVVSLELAKKLKELGVKQESLFKWNLDRIRGRWEISQYIISTNFEDEKCSAYSVAELGEMLPHTINLKGDVTCSECDSVLEKGKTHSPILSIWNTDPRHWGIAYQGTHIALTKHGDNEANARAKMLVYLIENKLVAI